MTETTIVPAPFDHPALTGIHLLLARAAQHNADAADATERARRAYTEACAAQHRVQGLRLQRGRPTASR
jgi:hypothetical protein